MRKYQMALIESIAEQLEGWSRLEQLAAVEAESVHRFLHMICGTAGVVGLNEVCQTARDMMQAVSDRRTDWTAGELGPFLEPLSAAAQAAAAAEESSSRFEQPVVIVYDNSSAFISTLQSYMERRAFRLIPVCTIPEALEAVKIEQPECLIAAGDAQANHHDVFDLLERLRGLEARLNRVETDVTIIAPAGTDDRPAKVRAYRLGADDYLTMPVDMAVLAARLNRMVAKRRMIEQHIASGRERQNASSKEE